VNFCPQGKNLKKRFDQAFTLLELIIVVVIGAIFLALVLPNFSTLRAKAEGVVCAARLRNLYIVFSTQLNDGQGWPQVPTNIAIGSLAEQQWWLTYSSNNLGLTVRDWNCPTIARSLLANTNSGQFFLISYLPTLFDAKPMSSKIWPRVPWFTEIKNVHGSGILSVRSDGSVCPFQDP
jgi:prepilin-type N-terminal cleavage/methylation domain-containing protein